MDYCLLTIIIIIDGIQAVYAVGDSSNSWYISKRLLDMMNTYYTNGERRVEELNEIKWAQENSTHFEEGYVMGEIVERYRKMVDHVRTAKTSNTVYDTLKYTEYIQKLYFEIYHLVNMYHEIPQKFTMHPCMDGSMTIGSGDDPELKKSKWELKQEAKQREREKKNHLKLYKKMRMLFLTGHNMNLTVTDVKKKKAMWPLEYGWEVDYYW